MILQIQNRLAHMDDNAAAIPGRELGKLLYGKDSVFARNPTPEEVLPDQGLGLLLHLNGPLVSERKRGAAFLILEIARAETHLGCVLTGGCITTSRPTQLFSSLGAARRRRVRRDRCV